MQNRFWGKVPFGGFRLTYFTQLSHPWFGSSLLLVFIGVHAMPRVGELRSEPWTLHLLPAGTFGCGELSTWMGVHRMLALGERGSATRARCLLWGGGHAGVTRTLLDEAGPGLGQRGDACEKLLRSQSPPTMSDLRLQTTQSSQFPAEEPPGRWARGLCRGNDWCS